MLCLSCRLASRARRCSEYIWLQVFAAQPQPVEDDVEAASAERDPTSEPGHRISRAVNSNTSSLDFNNPEIAFAAKSTFQLARYLAVALRIVQLHLLHTSYCTSAYRHLPVGPLQNIEGSLSPPLPSAAIAVWNDPKHKGCVVSSWYFREFGVWSAGH